MNSEDLRNLAESNQLDMIEVESSVNRVVWCRSPPGDDWFFDSGYAFWGAVWNKYFAKILKMSCTEIISTKYDIICRDDLDLLWKEVTNPLKIQESQVSRFDSMSPWMQVAYAPDLTYWLSDFIFLDVALGSSMSAFDVSLQVQVQQTKYVFQLSEGILLDSCGESRLYALPWLSKLFEDKPTASDVKRYLRRLLKWIEKRKDDSTIQSIPATIVLFEHENGLIDLSKEQFPNEVEIASQVFCGSGVFEKVYKFLNLEHSQTWQKWS
jgi:hypothetical protein